ncbi:MAG TPA: zinc ribbon domain-containing protein [Pyrinomonadaceae bacterium]|jgi:hypothetical protein
MHCPRCGQLQISEEIKFCSRCGFPLGLVSEILSHGGFLPQLADINEKKSYFTRKNGFLVTVFWFIIFTMLLPAILGASGVNRLPGMVAIIGFFGSLIMLIVSIFILKPAPKKFVPQNQEFSQAMPQNLYGARQNALPPQTSQPVESYMPPAGAWRAPNTGELVEPGSVTDGTTKLLKKDE